jgi:hypothetical protein
VLLQILEAVSGLLGKAESFCTENGIAPQTPAALEAIGEAEVDAFVGRDMRCSSPPMD